MINAKQFKGVESPREMGTTGLAAWVLLGGSKESRIFRIKQGLSIVQNRHRKNGVVNFIDLLIRERKRDKILRQEIEIVKGLIA